MILRLTELSINLAHGRLALLSGNVDAAEAELRNNIAFLSKHADVNGTQTQSASRMFLAEALKLVTQAGYVVLNVDSTLILASPKIGPHATAIRTHVADLLGIRPDCVGLKAKTPEGMGTDNAAIAHVLLLAQCWRR